MLLLTRFIEIGLLANANRHWNKVLDLTFPLLELPHKL